MTTHKRAALASASFVLLLLVFLGALYLLELLSLGRIAIIVASGFVFVPLVVFFYKRLWADED